MSEELKISITGDGDQGAAPGSVFKDTTSAGDEWAKLVGDNKEAMAALEKLGYTLSAAAQKAQSTGPAVKPPSQAHQNRQEQDEWYLDRQRRMDEKQQQRDEDWLARQERREERRAELERKHQERQQDRDEDYAARQEMRDWQLAMREVKLVPEAIALHDDESYRRNAREAMANRERSKRANEVRREMDPEFAKEEDMREMRQNAQLLAQGGAAIGGKVGRLMGIASQLMGNAEVMKGGGGSSNGGGGNAGASSQPPSGGSGMAKQVGNAASASGGAMTGAAAAVPIAGAIIAAAEMAKEMMDEGVRSAFSVSAAVVSGDIDQRMNSFAQGLGAAVPVTKEFVSGINSMRSEVKQTAEKFAMYNANIASQLANQQVAEMNRDIMRATRMGPQMEAANAARFKMEQKMQDIADKHMPQVLDLMEKLFNAATGALVVADTLTPAAKVLLAIGSEFIPLVDIIKHGTSLLAKIGANTTPANNNEGADLILANFLNLRNNLGPANTNVLPMAPPPGPVVGMP